MTVILWLFLAGITALCLALVLVCTPWGFVRTLRFLNWLKDAIAPPVCSPLEDEEPRPTLTHDRRKGERRGTGVPLSPELHPMLATPENEQRLRDFCIKHGADPKKLPRRIHPPKSYAGLDDAGRDMPLKFSHEFLHGHGPHTNEGRTVWKHCIFDATDEEIGRWVKNRIRQFDEHDNRRRQMTGAMHISAALSLICMARELGLDDEQVMKINLEEVTNAGEDLGTYYIRVYRNTDGE